MQPLVWTVDDLVFVPELDSEHQMLFNDAERVRQAVAHPAVQPNLARLAIWQLSKALLRHLANEERLMRSSRYSGLQWHESQHRAGRIKMAQLTEAAHGCDDRRIHDTLRELAVWMRDHINLADRMFAAHLRNNTRQRLAS